MCDCKGGSGGPVIIQCGGTTSNPPPQDDGGGGGGGGGTQLTCSKVVVRVNTLRVNNAGSEDFFDNPLDFADQQGDHQWVLTITVGNVSNAFRRDPVRDGQSFNLGFDFPVEIPNTGTTFTIQASGVEEQVFADRSLPPAQASHGLGDNFGIGSSHQIQGTDSDFDYTIDYTVSCATPAVQSVIRRDSVVAFVQRLMPGPASKKIQPDSAVSFFVNRMHRRGLRLLQVQQDLLVFEGTRSVAYVAKQAFRKSQRAERK